MTGNPKKEELLLNNNSNGKLNKHSRINDNTINFC